MEDATLTLFDLISSHLDSAVATVRVLFMDFSSAFNTIQPHVFIKRLLDLEVNTDLVLWIRQFLCDQPQRVRLSSCLCGQPVLSDELVLNTGVPQGCILSPVLFSVYTDEYTCNNPVLILIKYADDMALISHLKNEFSLAEYFLQIGMLNDWFKSCFLELNVSKLKNRFSEVGMTITDVR